MYHRFSLEKDPTGRKIDAEIFEWQLNKFKSGWQVIRLKDYLQRLKEGKSLKKIVVLTIDDGYCDFYDIAFPLLKKYGLQATFFPTVEFVNGKIWLWPDRIDYILRQISGCNTEIDFNNKSFLLDVSTPDKLQCTWQKLSDFCISISNEEKWKFLYFLERELNVTVPEKPTPAYEPVSWDQLCELSRNGIEIGSHTLNHPILSKLKQHEVNLELKKSKTVLEEKLGIFVQTLCYPNGMPEDINGRVLEQMKKAGYEGAVTIKGGNLFERYRIPRTGIGNSRTDFLWKLCGMGKLTTFLFKGQELV
jgi:peptidoglycan/xylan/chitin deacetylase (PgdA/CDA1 family)